MKAFHGCGHDGSFEKLRILKCRPNKSTFARGCRTRARGLACHRRPTPVAHKTGIAGLHSHNFCMTSSLRHTLDFLLYQWLEAETLQQRSRFPTIRVRPSMPCSTPPNASPARSTRRSTGWSIWKSLAPETELDGIAARELPQATYEARRAYAESGLLSAAQDYDIGGMQLPYGRGCGEQLFAAASISIGSNLLTSGNANLLMVHGTDLQKQVFALNEFNGAGQAPCALSEPQAGSPSRMWPRAPCRMVRALRPIRWARATASGGNKMWISSGDHELTENIVHLVLAKIPGPDGKPIPGVKGISAVHRAQEAGGHRRPSDRRAQRRGAGGLNH